MVLLVASIVTMIAVLVASSSDGGVQVVDRYYEKAVAWDSLAAIRRSSNALGWRADVAIDSFENGRRGRLVMTDADGAPLSGLSGKVTVARPQWAQSIAEHRLLESAVERGVYYFEFPYSEPGLWDLTVDASVGSNRFVNRIRIER